MEPVQIHNEIYEKEPVNLDAAQIFLNPDNDSLQVVFNSKNGCRFQHQGNGGCSMCSYGHGDKDVTSDDVDEIFDTIDNKYSGHSRLILGSNGSILDKNEFSQECLSTLLQRVGNTSFKNVFIETHCTTITDDVLKQIQSGLSSKNISFELGLETASEEKRFININKPFSNEQYLTAFNKIHDYGFRSVANILVGIPYEDTKAQLIDAIDSVKFCANNNIDEVVLFPYNAKPNTKTWLDKVPQISAWLPIEVLKNLGDEISIVYFAWYGNKEIKINGEKNIPPKTCKRCQDYIEQFYKAFIHESDPSLRHAMVDYFISLKPCNCYDELVDSLSI